MKGFYFVLILLILFFSFQFSFPQNKASIKGFVIDVKTSQPIPSANFVITSVKDSTKIFGTSSDSSGSLLLTDIPFGMYNAKISSMGYKSRTRKNIFLSQKNKELNLDTVLLTPSNITLSEVQIIADKYRFSYDKEDKSKIIINPDRSWGNNAYDMLENTPLVSVDIETGAIVLFGKKGTTLYIDGVPASYLGVTRSEDLKLYSAADIDKFEIILNPSGEYEAGLEEGIVNIVTKKTKSIKYNGNIGSKISNNNQYGGNLSGAYNFQNSSIRGSYLSSYFGNNINYDFNKAIEYQNSVVNLNQVGSAEDNKYNNALNIRIAYNPEKQYFFQVSSMVSQLFSRRNSAYQNRYNYSAYDYDSRSYVATKQNSINSGLIFNKSFNEPKKKLGIALAYIHNTMNMDNNISQDFVGSNKTLNTENISDNINNSVNWAINYTHPTDLVTLSAIYKGASSILDLDDSYSGLNEKSKLKYKNVKNSLFLSGNTNLGIFKLDAGGNFFNKFSSSTNFEMNNYFSSNYFIFDPAIRASIGITDQQNLFLHYWGNSQTPLNRELNPYVDLSDSSNIITGNPELKPVVMRGYSVSYTFQKDATSISGGVSYYDIKDIIELVSEVENQRTLRTTYQNIGSRKSYGVSLDINTRPFEWLELNSWASWDERLYKSINGSNIYASWDWGFDTKLHFGILRILFNTRYSSGSMYLQEKIPSEIITNAAAKILLFDKNLSITLRASDIFNSSNRNKSKTGSGFNYNNYTFQKTRIFSLDVNYYFESKASDEIQPESNIYDLPDDF